MIRISRAVAGATIILMPIIGWAELAVIFDSGDTEPLAPFLAPLEPTERSADQSIVSADRGVEAVDLESLLPIRSPGLAPGRVEARLHDRPLATPFFLIGADARSQQWLADNRARLKEIGAIGMLVEADSLADLESIANLAEGLSITPASGADLARALGIDHYPVLITRHGIEQ